MKIFFTCFILLFTLNSKAQIFGDKIKGPYKTKYGTFKEGDTLKIGYGTNPNGDFRFIYSPPNFIIGTKELPFPKMYSGAQIVIKFFKKYETNNTGSKIWTVFNYGKLGNSIIELEPAIENGEVIVAGFNAKQNNSQAAPIDVADELLKLKKLLDMGVLTQTEFDAQKKKLLAM